MQVGSKGAAVTDCNRNDDEDENTTTNMSENGIFLYTELLIDRFGVAIVVGTLAMLQISVLLILPLGHPYLPASIAIGSSIILVLGGMLYGCWRCQRQVLSSTEEIAVEENPVACSIFAAFFIITPLVAGLALSAMNFWWSPGPAVLIAYGFWAFLAVLSLTPVMFRWFVNNMHEIKTAIQGHQHQQPHLESSASRVERVDRCFTCLFGKGLRILFIALWLFVLVTFVVDGIEEAKIQRTDFHRPKIRWILQELAFGLIISTLMLMGILAPMWIFFKVHEAKSRRWQETELANLSEDTHTVANSRHEIV